MGETAQMYLKDPQPSDWDQFHKESKGSKYQVPPPATKDGREVVYYGQLPTAFPAEFLGDYNDYRKYTLCSREAPIKLVRNGNGADGYLITRPPFVSLSPWKNGYNGRWTIILNWPESGWQLKRQNRTCLRPDPGIFLQSILWRVSAGVIRKVLPQLIRTLPIARWAWSLCGLSSRVVIILL